MILNIWFWLLFTYYYWFLFDFILIKEERGKIYLKTADTFNVFKILHCVSYITKK